MVSAVITTHNRKDLVTKAINSVQNQTYKDIELIVVDDESDDKTRIAIESLAKEKCFKYIYIEHSEGGNHARNLGIKEACGEYVAFLDDDDEWLPTKIEKQVALGNDIVTCGRIFEYNYKKRIEQNVDKLLDGDLSQRIFSGIQYTTSCLMIKKNLLEKIGMFDENLRYWQEYDLLIRACQEANVGACRENLVLYRVITTDKNRLTNHLDGWEETVKIIQDKHSNLIDSLPPEIKSRMALCIARDGAIRANNCRDKKRERAYLWDVFKLERTPINLVKFIINASELKKWG